MQITTERPPDQESISSERYNLRYEYAQELIKELAQEITLTPEQLKQIEIFHFAPCGMFETNVEGIIKAHAEQTIPTEQKALMFLVNGKQGDEDMISAQIKELKEKYPDLNIFVLTHQWTQDGIFSMGMIRHIPVGIIKYLWESNEIDTNPIILSGDADIEKVSPRYYEIYLEKILEDNYGSGGYIFERESGNFLYDLNIMLYRIHSLIKSTKSKHIRNIMECKYVEAPGGNMTFRLNQYKDESMYPLNVDNGEDSGFAKKLRDSKVTAMYVRGTAVISDPRRIKSTFNRGGFVHNAWVGSWKGDGSDGREGGEIEQREFSIEEIKDYLNKYFCSRLKSLFLYKNHTSNQDFVIQANFYAFQIMKYLKVALRSGHSKSKGITILPKYKLNYFTSESTADEQLLRDLSAHSFIDLKE